MLKFVKLAQTSLLITVLLLVSVLTPMAGAAAAADTAVTVYVSDETGDNDSGTGTEEHPYKTLDKAVEQAVALANGASETAATVKLLTDLPLEDKQALNAEAVEITITSVEGGPYSIYRKADYSGRMIELNGGTFIFDQLMIDGKDVAVTASDSRGMGVYVTSGTAIFETVEIKNHRIASNSGTAVIFAYGYGKATITEGTLIQKNSLSGNSGGNNPNAILSAGSGGQLIIEGGLITENTVEAGSDAVIVGIGLYQTPVFTMKGGKITNNHLFGKGENEAGDTIGNVAVNMRGTASQARFEFSGNPYVYDNKDAAGEQRNVFLKNTAATGNAYLSLIGAMTEGAKVGVYANIMPTLAEPIVDVAIGRNYTATATDAVYFVSDKASQAEIQYNDAGHKVILAPIPPELDHVWLNQASVNGREITLVFNEDIALTDLDGFAITVDGNPASIESYQVHGNELVIILFEPPTGDITLNYTEHDGNLEGQNGMPVADFTFHYEISFVNEFSVTSPAGDPAKVADSRPQIKGTVDAGSTVKVIVKQNDAEVAGAGGSATVDEAGNWIFSPNFDLEAGTYTFEITATSSDGTKVLTKTKEILVTNSPVPVNGRFIEGENTVTITFDRPVAFDAGSVVDGFSISVGGTPVTVVSAAVYDADPTQVVLTLPEGTKLSIDKPVYVAYEGETGHLIDAGEGGTSVEDFELYAEDPFAADLQITSPEGNVTDSTPTVTGTVYANTDTLSVTIQDSAGNPVDPDGWLMWEQGAPTWSYQVTDELPPGTYTITVTGTADGRSVTKEKTFTIDAVDDNSGSSGGNSSGGTAPSTPQPPAVQQPAVIEVTVDGVEDSFASGVVSGENGRQMTAVQIDADLLNKALNAGDKQDLVIYSPNEGDMNVTGLTVADVERLADTGTRLEVGNLLAIYPVPGEELNIGDISRQLGGAAAKDIDLHIDIARASSDLIARAENRAQSEGYELLVEPVALDMTFTHNGETIQSGLLGGYAKRYIALPEDIDLNRITTGVIVYPDGSVYHVPTVVTQIQNRYYALIHDLRGNGTYSVIWNPQDFADVKGHWGQEDINNIAARLDLKGNGDNTFSPSRAITRSEFAEIVVLGLGLMGMEAANSQFPDVPDSAWYRHSVAIANEFGIVKGYDNGTFAGNQEITREQGIAMVARAYRLIHSESRLDESQINAVLANYEDRSAVAVWAREGMALMIQAGIVQGQDQQRLNPQTKITRAEVAALIARLLKTTDLIDK